MKTSFVAYSGAAVLALSLFGAGCISSLNVTPVTQVTPVIPTSTTPVVPSSPTSTTQANWKTYTQAQPSFSFRYPSEAIFSSTNKAFPEDIAFVDLGSVATTNTQAVSVPTRQLHVRLEPVNSSKISNCLYSESGWPAGFAANHIEHLMIDGQAVCLSTESDAGAGNFYNTYNYTSKIGNQYVVMSFVAHSVNCQNYPDPAKQCVAFDEARDTAIFKDIVNTLRTQ